MKERIETGFMAFVGDGAEGIGAVRGVSADSITIYVENAGDFVVAISAVTDVHSQKVMLDPRRLKKELLIAIGHAHDSEDPDIAG